MFPAISTPNIALILFITGALCVYVEFLRPGLIVPGVAGAALLVLSIADFATCPLRWPPVALVTVASASFLLAIVLATRSPIARLLTWLGAGFLAAAALFAGNLLTGLFLGIPFAMLTGYLVSVAIRARRNKTCSS